MKTVIFGLAVALAGALATPAAATQIVLSGQNVIGASSVYGVGADAAGTPFNQDPADSRVYSQFGAGNIFDSQTLPPTETLQAGYWISGDGRFQQTTAGPTYITVDLGASYLLTGFDLFNTSNASFGDRGTGAFTLYGSNGVVTDGDNGQTLADAVALASGTLVAHNGDPLVIAQSFAANDPTAYRYLQFVPTSVASTGDPASPVAYGLNELRVFGTLAAMIPPANAVPEPSTWAMLVLGFGAIGARLRRRPRPVAAIA